MKYVQMHLTKPTSAILACPVRNLESPLTGVTLHAGEGRGLYP